ncbi:hypothetical protein RC88_07700 [Pectobacterium parvum]|uniref:Condensation domain-containing protein n=1 Tax=Pectobacterium parvum TaxID=2778550 RepID=A0AAP9IEZ4_9GAMM|nr:hypothetical protein RC88_07700 [Pectobacterium parvum]MCU1801012.1 hypothetical protein [Pectobacterium parvum]QHQ23171.1 hypothetical protein GMX10_03070 [Pectobacterium parvum]
MKHNIITDAWSERLILNDLWQRYNDLNRHISLAILSPQIQTIDLVNNRMTRPYEGDSAYWQQHLSGCKELDFPLDKPRSVSPSHIGENAHYQFDTALAECLIQRAKQWGVTPFVILTAALNYLLSKYTNQQDIVIGTAIAARDDVDVESVSGFHVNTVPLRTELSTEETIGSLISKTSSICVNAWRHQYLSFDRILHLIDHERVSNKNPLFQIMAVLQNAGDICKTDLYGCTLRRLPVTSGFSMFDMTWNFSLENDGLEIELHYASELFHHATIQMILGNYAQILGELLTCSSTTKLASINPLCEAEQRWLLQQASNGNMSARGTLLEQIRCIVHNRPGDIAVCCEHEQYSYGQLWTVSDRIAQTLQSLGNDTFSVGII